MTNLKRQIVGLALVVSFIVLPNLATAENPNLGQRPKASEGKEMLGKDKIKNFGEKAVLRLTAALDRADTFRERVASHISQFPNPKFDPTLANQKLNEASDAIAEGRLAVTAIQTAMTDALTATSTTPFGDIRIKIREAMTAVRTAHLKIVEAIRLVKANY